jgi:hypothetical protein
VFDEARVRFALSGTLILAFSIANGLASRRCPARSRSATPRWVTPLGWVSICVYYVLIGPAGGALLGGAGNVAGLVLCAASFAMRLAPNVQYPELGSRSLFYFGLPIAVGVPWGLAVLSLPAIVASVSCSMRADRLATSPATAMRFRMMYGVW